jgi:hypothetical protein
MPIKLSNIKKNCNFMSAYKGCNVTFIILFLFYSLQTIIHVASIVISIGTFYAFSLLYNSVCVQCLNLPSNYWVVQHAASSVTYWSVIFLSVVLALIPRFVYHAAYSVMTSLTSEKGALTILCKASYC